MNAKVPVFVICVEAYIYLFLYNLYDCIFNSSFLFSFFSFNFKISELCNLEDLFSLNASPAPYRPSKTFFRIKLGSENKNVYLQDFRDAQMWILILLILLILILLILKFKKVFG